MPFDPVDLPNWQFQYQEALDQLQDRPAVLEFVKDLINTVEDLRQRIDEIGAAMP